MNLLRIAPLSRIEGHAALTIQLDDQGNVLDTRLSVMSLRGFERFVQGRPAEELPRIVTRICGICPWQHHLASVKAVEAAMGVTPPPAAVKLRELCQLLATIPDKILHFYFLAAPDLILGPDADPADRNVFGLIKAAPDLARQAVRARMRVSEMLEMFTGKIIHPVSAVVGGFTKPLGRDERAAMQAGMGEITAFCLQSMRLAREKLLPPHIEMFKAIGDYATAYMGTVRPGDGALDIFDGQLRVMHPDGAMEDFPAERYSDYLAEESREWSWLKFPYLRKAGGLKFDPQDPVGVYRVNTLARLNVADCMSTPLAQKELEIFRKEFGRPAHVVGLYHWARLVELVYCCERVEELLRDPEITDTNVRLAEVKPQAGEGVGHLEAPRGTLLYHVRTDDDGILDMVNIIAGTTHNNAGMHISMKLAAQRLLDNRTDMTIEQGLYNRVEMCLRAYDP